jgi:cytosolic carboxypeptidase protein 2/3
MGKSYYTLTFTYEFEYDNDAVHFAYAVPFTYTDLLDDIAAIEMDPLRSPLVSRKTLCKTLAGVNCDYLTITSREKKEGAT